MIEYELKFEEAKADGPIYQDKSITVITRRHLKPQPKVLIEYTGKGWEQELKEDVEGELAWRRKNGIR